MIELMSIDNLRAAQALTDYLNTQNVPATVSKQGSVYLVSIVSAEDHDKAMSIVKEFSQDPNNEKFRLASWESTSDHYFENNQYASGSLLDEIFSRSGIVTISITVICVGLYALMAFQDAERIFVLLSFPDLSASQGMNFQVWKLLTPIFLHFSVPHLIFNLMWWWVYGGQIEKNQSGIQLVMLAVSIGLISNTAQYYTSGPNFGGLSGVVYGILAYCWVWGKIRPQDGFFFPNSLFNFMMIWLLIGYTGLLDSLMGKMANSAHLGGLLSGLLLGFVFASRKRFI